MTITLLDGTQVDTSNLTWNQSSYHVFWDSGAGGQVDVTNTMTRAQKLATFPGFDNATDNLRVYNESKGGSGPSAPLPTNTASILVSQLYNDPFSAPINQAGQILGKAGETAAKQITTNAGLDLVLILGAAAVGIYLFWPKILASGGR